MKPSYNSEEFDDGKQADMVEAVAKQPRSPASPDDSCNVTDISTTQSQLLPSSSSAGIQKATIHADISQDTTKVKPPLSPHALTLISNDDDSSSISSGKSSTALGPLHAISTSKLMDREGQEERDDMFCVEVVPPETVTASGLCGNLQEGLEIGDHVYQWRRWMGIPGVFQHHGIVMDIQYQQDLVENGQARTGPTIDEATKNHRVIARLTIADFSNVEHQSNTRKIADPVEQQRRRLSGLTQEGILRTYTDTDKWHKVEYQASWWKRSVYRAGTCTSISSDAVGLVLARVNYILRHPDTLPDYHVVNANCECVAVWCKTGTWSTLQASSFLELTAAGQVKSSATLAATAASTQVTVQAPAAGLWGWLGYTTATQVTWLSLHPMVMPALVGYAAFSVGIPTMMYVNARKQWKRTSERLKESFWEDAMKNPDVFAECLTHWSDK